MLVKNWMSQNVVSVSINDTMDYAIRLLKEHRIRMLPVLDNDTIVGVVTDRDLKRASASDATSLEIHELLYLISRIRVGDIMSRNPVTVPLDYTVEETAQLLLEKNISGVPVVDRANKLVGVITQSDLFRVLIVLTGFGKKGVQFGFEAEDRPGSIQELADIIRESGGRLASILTSYEGVEEGRRKVYIRAHGIDRGTIDALKQQLQKKAVLLYMVDHRENRREIFDDRPAAGRTGGRK